MSNQTKIDFATLIENEIAKQNVVEKKDYFNYLIYGAPKSGKTALTRTAKRPILNLQFDPNAAKVDMLQNPMAEGWYAFLNFVEQDFDKPTSYSRFIEFTKSFIRNKKYESVGTIVIDSITSLSQIAINEVLKRANRAGTHAHQQDYPVAMALTWKILNAYLNIPTCDIIVLAHEEIHKDEELGTLLIEPLLTGKHRGRVPLLFDEIYIMDASNTRNSSGKDFKLYTAPTGRYRSAGSCMAGTVFETKEKCDLRYLREKAGHPIVDLV
jgi:hypothetical protein